MLLIHFSSEYSKASPIPPIYVFRNSLFAPLSIVRLQFKSSIIAYSCIPWTSFCLGWYFIL